MEGLGAAVLVDNEYPMRVAFTLVSEAASVQLERGTVYYDVLKKPEPPKPPNGKNTVQTNNLT
eukprot:2949718-Amphidinium_carterae.1